MLNPLISKDSVQIDAQPKVFNCMGYGRKSTEEVDTHSLKNQSDTIDQAFRKICTNDPYNKYHYKGYLSDEDFTGTNSDRPDFQKLLKLVIAKEINMIIVCDLSRLSRNQEETLHYVQGFFVSMDVRFICLDLPSIDSYLAPESIYNIQVPLHGMFNEYFAAETSQKIKTKLRTMMNEGKYIGSFAPYGWIKDPEDNHKLLIDKYAYDVLHHIKDMLFEGNTPNCIAISLNKEGVLSPGGYEKSKGSKHNFGNSDPTGFWSGDKVKTMMLRPVNVGTLVQGKQKFVSFKNHKKIKTDIKECVIVENAVPAIFTVEEQKKIFDILSTRKSGYTNKAKKAYLFSGYLKCADCGRSVIHKKTSVSLDNGDKKYYDFYLCNTYKRTKVGCTPHRIGEEKLKKAVLKTIQQQIKLAVTLENVVKKSNINSKSKDERTYKSKTIEIITNELNKISKYKKILYVDFRDKLIDREEYLQLKHGYNTKESELKQTLEGLKLQEKNLNEDSLVENKFLVNFLKHKNIMDLDRKILTELVDHIIIYEDKRIEIVFKFADEYKNLLTVLNENKLL